MHARLEYPLVACILFEEYFAAGLAQKMLVKCGGGAAKSLIHEPEFCSNIQ